MEVIEQPSNQYWRYTNLDLHLSDWVNKIDSKSQDLSYKFEGQQS